MEDLHPSRAYSYETSYVLEAPSTLIQIYVLGDGESDDWRIPVNFSGEYH